MGKYHSFPGKELHIYSWHLLKAIVPYKADPPSTARMHWIIEVQCSMENRGGGSFLISFGILLECS